MRDSVRGVPVLLSVFLLLGAMPPDALGQNLEIHCLDVWQGDCTLIISPTAAPSMLPTPATIAF